MTPPGDDSDRVVVIGGGVVGASVSLALARAGRPVVLTAPRADSLGASRAAGAMVDTFGELSVERPDEWELKLALEAQRMYPGWLQSLADDSEMPIAHQRGLVVVSNGVSPDDGAIMANIRASMQEHEEPFETLDPRHVPGVRPNRQHPVQEALLMRSALSVDIPELLRALEACLVRRSNVEILDDRATSVTSDTAAWWTVRTAGGSTLAAAQVVVCAGAFSLEVLGADTRRKLHDVPELFAGAGASCLVEGGPALELGVRTPNRASACGLHCLPRAGSTYLGASNYFWTVPGKATVGPSLGEISDLVRGCLDEINTGFRKATFRSARFGLRPISADGKPWLGESSLPGLYFATGTHRTGVHLAPVIAEALGAIICGKPSPWRDAFAPRDRRPRFSTDLARGVRAMMDVMLHPGGHLPYSKDVELTHFIRTLLEMALFDGHEDLRRRMGAIHARAASLEDQDIMRMFYEILREVHPDGGPYPD